MQGDLDIQNTISLIKKRKKKLIKDKVQEKSLKYVHNYLVKAIELTFNRPGVAGAVLKQPRDYLITCFLTLELGLYCIKLDKI